MTFGEKINYAGNQKKMIQGEKYKNIGNEDLSRLKLIEKLPKEERGDLFATMEAFFAKYKLQSLLK